MTLTSIGIRAAFAAALAAAIVCVLHLGEGTAVGENQGGPGPACPNQPTVSDEPPQAQLPRTGYFGASAGKVGFDLTRVTQATRATVKIFLLNGHLVGGTVGNEYTCTKPQPPNHYGINVDRRVVARAIRRHRETLRVRIVFRMVNGSALVTTLRGIVTISRI
jgi:hypothetical protein